MAHQCESAMEIRSDDRYQISIAISMCDLQLKPRCGYFLWFLVIALFSSNCVTPESGSLRSAHWMSSHDSAVLHLLSTMPIVQIVTAQLDNDKLPDILIVHATANEWDYARSELYIYLSTRKELIRIDTIDKNRRSAWPITLVGGDIDGDGISDIVAANHVGGELTWFRGRGSGSFANEQILHSSNATFGIAELQMADLNNDGSLDLIVTNQRSSAKVDILINDKSGHFRAGSSINIGYPPTHAYASDFDGDNNTDLAVVCPRYSAYTVEVSILHGLGNGSFAIPPLAVLSIDQDVQRLLVSDYNNDTRPDIIGSSSWKSTVQIFSNFGIGAFSNRSDISVGSSILDLASIDLNDDGKSEIIVTTGKSVIIFYYDSESKEWKNRIELPVLGARFVTAGDFDGDGFNDIVISAGGDLHLFRGPTTGGT